MLMYIFAGLFGLVLTVVLAYFVYKVYKKIMNGRGDVTVVLDLEKPTSIITTTNDNGQTEQIIIKEVMDQDAGLAWWREPDYGSSRTNRW